MTGTSLFVVPAGLAPAITTGAADTVDEDSMRNYVSEPDDDDYGFQITQPPGSGTLEYFDDIDNDSQADGGFIYTPNNGYVGSDFFTYKAVDVISPDPAESLEVTVYIEVVLPQPDIDTDSNNNGFIEGDMAEDNDEMLAPGKILFHNIDDDNANGIADRDEAPLLDAQGQPVTDDDLKPAVLSIDAKRAGLTGFTLELVPSANLKLWATPDKQPLALSYTIGSDPIPGMIYVEGYDLGQGTVDWILSSPAGEVNRDTVLFSVAWVDIVAYRPQTKTYGAPFPKTAVPADKEKQVGVGIRRNGDDDDGDGQPDYLIPGPAANENDLIEVGLRMLPASLPGVEYRLERTNTNVKVWGTADKASELFSGGVMEAVVPGGDPVTKWVEWVNMDPAAAAAELQLWIADAVHDEKVVYSRTPFYPFHSVVIAFGGKDKAPLDPAVGPFQMALDLYNDGYDVHAYNERSLQTNPGDAHAEVVSAVEGRKVTQVAIFGHSWGGGGTYVLADRLRTIRPQGTYTIPFTAYIDAIVWDVAWPAQLAVPPESQYHVNYYQRSSGIKGNIVIDANFNLNVNDTSWGAALNHTSIDNHANVRDRILNGSTAGGIEGPHDGLKQRVTR